MSYDGEALRRELERDYGRALVSCRDAQGNWTDGVGHRLRHWELPSFVDPVSGEPVKTLSEAECDALLAEDLADAEHGLTRALPGWRDLDAVRQRALVHLAFTLGDRLARFAGFLDAAADGDWPEAADALGRAAWTPAMRGRMDRIAAMLRDGDAPMPAEGSGGAISGDLGAGEYQ